MFNRKENADLLVEVTEFIFKKAFDYSVKSNYTSLPAYKKLTTKISKEQKYYNLKEKLDSLINDFKNSTLNEENWSILWCCDLDTYFSGVNHILIVDIFESNVICKFNFFSYLESRMIMNINYKDFMFLGKCIKYKYLDLNLIEEYFKKSYQVEYMNEMNNSKINNIKVDTDNFECLLDLEEFLFNSVDYNVKVFLYKIFYLSLHELQYLNESSIVILENDMNEFLISMLVYDNVKTSDFIEKYFEKFDNPSFYLIKEFLEVQNIYDRKQRFIDTLNLCCKKKVLLNEVFYNTQKISYIQKLTTQKNTSHRLTNNLLNFMRNNNFIDDFFSKILLYTSGEYKLVEKKKLDIIFQQR